MYQRVLAFDYDGTLAHNGQVPPELQKALVRLHLAGYALFLVTGRTFQSIPLGWLSEVFTGIVWENGAVLCRTATNEVYMPYGYVDPRLVRVLESAGVPLEYGLSIVATWKPYEKTVQRVLEEHGCDVALIYNKGAVMILPPGATKGTGLEQLLELCGYSPRNLVSFGDGENDLSLLQTGEIGVAVADAVPGLKAVADLVTEQPGPSGVLEALEAFWLTGNPFDIPSRQERWVSLGLDEKDNTPFYLPSKALVDRNIGIFGDSGSGKSWLIGLLAESMHLSGYQILVIDPEGDFRSLHTLPRVIAFDSQEDRLAPPDLVITLLAKTSASIVLDLCAYPAEQCEAYVADLLRALRPLRENKFRPHWVVLEEAQHFFSQAENAVTKTLLPVLAGGGCAIVSYRPDRLYRPALEALNHCFITRLTEPEAIETVCQVFGMAPDLPFGDTPLGRVWLDGRVQLRLQPTARRVQHVRHLHKYLDRPLPPHKRFYFRDAQGFINQEAASLFEFKQLLPNLPLSSLTYHQSRGDFAAWARGSLGDEELATTLEQLSEQALDGEALREAVLREVATHYAHLRALRH